MQVVCNRLVQVEVDVKSLVFGFDCPGRVNVSVDVNVWH